MMVIETRLKQLGGNNDNWSEWKETRSATSKHLEGLLGFDDVVIRISEPKHGHFREYRRKES
jgi:hypothetical protein